LNLIGDELIRQDCTLKNCKPTRLKSLN